VLYSESIFSTDSNRPKQQEGATQFMLWFSRHFMFWFGLLVLNNDKEELLKSLEWQKQLINDLLQ
jgi:hypothetical protein